MTVLADDQRDPLALELLAQVKALQIRRLSVEHLCRIAVQEDEYLRAKRLASRAAGLDAELRSLNARIYSAEAAG